jgi:hypothetical protein
MKNVIKGDRDHKTDTGGHKDEDDEIQFLQGTPP